jgi:hypothetical protein
MVTGLLSFGIAGLEVTCEKPVSETTTKSKSK